MIQSNIGTDTTQLLSRFRSVARSHTESFRVIRDHVLHLLGPSYKYHSGIFREGLLRDFFDKVLPDAVSIDSGFIYGFEVEKTSQQLDAIIWDSAKHSAMYR